MDLEYSMNCFEWNNLLLISFVEPLASHQEAALIEHESQCTKCRRSKSNQKNIHEILKNQRRYLWKERNDPLFTTAEASNSKLRDPTSSTQNHPHSLTLKRSWDLIPWYFKILIESSTVILVSFSVVKSGQWLIGTRENEIDQQVSQIDFSPESKAIRDAPPGLKKYSQSNGSSSKETDSYPETIPQDEYLEDDEGAGEVTVEVGRSEVWRFYIKTDTPAELRTKVQDILKQLRVFDGTPGTTGIEAPGGVQFSFYLPSSQVNTIMNSLSEMAPKIDPSQIENDSPLSQLFTWYKKKSLQPIPAGQAKVIIWLSQM
jgi:hypothetical protein